MSRRLRSILLASGAAALLAAAPPAAGPEAPRVVPANAEGALLLPHPILFVTQVPIPQDFATIGSVFANHAADLQSAGRGGDLWIRYPDGALRNLTAEAGYGTDGFQGATSIAVRDPAVHWSGARAVFSMAIGAPEDQYVWEDYYWQLYEVTGLGQGETAVVTRVPNQPGAFNNVSPVYASDGRILFTSDRPRNGAPHLYPQLDEYESTPTVTGLWSLDPASGALALLDHAPSGSFTPAVDSFGRVVFTRWDHLQRDQQADSDELYGDVYGTFDWSSEEPDSVPLAQRVEVFPEPRPERQDLLDGTNLEGHTLNHFFPWQVHQDGTGEEVLVHLGRHELHDYFNRSLDDDPNLVEFIADGSGRFNPNAIENLLQIEEDPGRPGVYVGADAPEFQTHAAGMLVELTAPPGQPADQIAVTYLTHPDTRTVVPDGETPPPGHSGHYREPVYLADGTLIAVHTPETRAAGNDGTRANPIPRYDFRVKLIEPGGSGFLEAGAPLTPGIVKTVSYWDPDVLVQYSGELWELDPVEVRPRPVPPVTTQPLEAPELEVFAAAAVDPQEFSGWLRASGLALMVTRNATTRDAADRQQPFNLAVAGGGEQTVGAPGLVYEIAHLQVFQADQIRGMGGPAEPDPGRRVLARPLHEAAATNPPNPSGPEGSVQVAADGSLAALVPARRALAWQLTDAAGVPVVRERNWITFQPGEIRACDGCHGVNSLNQAGEPPAVNPPQALADLLQYLAAAPIFADDFESGDLDAWSAQTP